MARVERRYTIQRTIRWLSRTAVRWGPQFSSSAPPRSPAPPFDHFPFGPAILRRRVSRALGCGGIFPCDQQAGARGRKRGREGNEGAGGGGAGVEGRVADTNRRSGGGRGRG